MSKNDQNSLWKSRYDDLYAKVVVLADEIERTTETVISEHPISASEEVFISHDWHICDNEQYALDHWGEGKYQRYILAEDFQADEKLRQVTMKFLALKRASASVVMCLESMTKSKKVGEIMPMLVKAEEVIREFKKINKDES